MAIHFACMCGRTFAVRATHAGEALRCPDCGERLVVPSQSTIVPPRQRDAKMYVAPPPPPGQWDEIGTPPPPTDAQPDTSDLTPQLGWRPPERPRPWWFPGRGVRLAILGVVFVVLAWTFALRSDARQLAVEANDMGVAAQEANHLHDAVKHYEAAIELDPDLFEAHYNLANVYTEWHRYGSAAREYRLALGLQPEHVEARVGLGVCLFYGGSFAEAEDHLRTALGAEPDNGEGHLYLSYVLHETGRHQEALAALKQAERFGAHFHAAYVRKLEEALGRQAAGASDLEAWGAD